jgi:hypothetical protein
MAAQRECFRSNALQSVHFCMDLRSRNLPDAPTAVHVPDPREISKALASVTREDLRGRYEPAGLKAAWPSTPVDRR